MKKIYAVVLVMAVLFLSSPVSAAELGLKRLAGKVGVIFPKDLGTGFMLGAAADMGELTENLTLVPLLSYWSSSKSESGFDYGISNFQIGADVQYAYKEVKGLYFGGGLSLNFLSFSYDVPPEYGPYYAGSTSDTKVGFDLLAGYEIPVGKNIGFANLKYNLISDMNTFMINVGVWFDMK
jgi:opacity protein-like surface antigen